MQADSVLGTAAAARGLCGGRSGRRRSRGGVRVGRVVVDGSVTAKEAEHRRTLRKLAPGGTVQRDAFVEWYVDWVLGDGDSEDDCTATDDDDDPAAESKAAATWASLTTAKEGSWKCEVCDVRNDKDASKCAACETPNPAAPKAAAGAPKHARCSAVSPSSFCQPSVRRPLASFNSSSTHAFVEASGTPCRG